MSLQTYILPLKKKPGYSLTFAKDLRHYVKKNYGEKYAIQYESKSRRKKKKKIKIFKKKKILLLK